MADGGGEHFLHAGAAARAFVADDDHVAGLHLAVDDAHVGIGLRLEDHGRAGVAEHFGLDAGRLDHGALGGEVAVEDRQSALLAVGVFDLADAVAWGRSPSVSGGSSRTERGRLATFSPSTFRLPPAVTAASSSASSLDRLGADVVVGDVLAERLAADGGAVEVEQAGPAARDAAQDRVDAAGVVDVFDVVVAAGGDLADVGRPLAELVDPLDVVVRRPPRGRWPACAARCWCCRPWPCRGSWRCRSTRR